MRNFTKGFVFGKRDKIFLEMPYFENWPIKTFWYFSVKLRSWEKVNKFCVSLAQSPDCCLVCMVCACKKTTMCDTNQDIEYAPGVWLETLSQDAIDANVLPARYFAPAPPVPPPAPPELQPPLLPPPSPDLFLASAQVIFVQDLRAAMGIFAVVFVTEGGIVRYSTIQCHSGEYCLLTFL